MYFPYKSAFGRFFLDGVRWGVFDMLEGSYIHFQRCLALVNEQSRKKLGASAPTPPLEWLLLFSTCHLFNFVSLFVFFCFPLQTYYGFVKPPIRYDRRAGKPRTQHNATLCQACRDGECDSRPRAQGQPTKVVQYTTTGTTTTTTQQQLNQQLPPPPPATVVNTIAAPPINVRKVLTRTWRHSNTGLVYYDEDVSKSEWNRVLCVLCGIWCEGCGGLLNRPMMVPKIAD